MEKVIVTILGEDKPGIVYGITNAFYDLGCNILEVSQTTLQTEFAGIFVVKVPSNATPETFHQRLGEEAERIGVSVSVKDLKLSDGPAPPVSEPYVITLRGLDRMGIIPEFTGVIAGFDVNIDHFKAIKIKNDTDHVIIAFEVSVPVTVHRPAFREALVFKANELDLEINVQHRDIFEAMYRL